MISEYVETGGAWWKSYGVTWPFARLRATPDVLEITVNPWMFRRRVFAFSKADVRTIRRTRFFFGVGVSIEHSKVDFPSFLIFWTFNYRRLKNALSELGYAVSDADGSIAAV